MNFMPITLQLAPQIMKFISEKEVAKFAKENGEKSDELSAPNVNVYELDISYMGQFFQRHERVLQAGEGVKLLPQILIVGLISGYDAFLTSLLRTVISRRPEIIMTSQKQITFQELLEFPSIEAAREALIDREIESVLRKSHHDQIDWMQTHFSVKLKEGLVVWPKFIELCERRNLFTHSGGIISDQYLKNCKEQGVDTLDATMGGKLGADPAYFKSSVETVHEMGLKLCYVLWRKFEPHDTSKADEKYNARCMDLIRRRQYALAESLLSFSAKIPKLKENIRRMMVVNLANAMALQRKKDESVKILNSEDWSAASVEFEICIAAVKADVDAVIKLMDNPGNQMSAETYRTWPVFRQIWTNDRFRAKFEELYGEPLFKAASTSNVAGNELPSGAQSPA
ncbi:MAG: hypothetical protein JSR78_09195 [Proteobacteria bacterium]|nr:hypothetical protein [Pseudomonadota bacterium]